MFTLPIDILFVFTVTTPFIGWIAEKFGRRELTGIYSSIGFAVSGFTLYNLFNEVSSSPVLAPVNAGIFEASLRIDYLSIFVASIFIALAFLVTVYSIKYMERDTGLPFYYTLLPVSYTHLTLPTTPYV